MTRFDTQPQIQKLPVRATTDLTGNIYGKLKVLGFYGVVSRILSLQDAAEEYGLSAGCIRYRLSAGWSIDKALNTKSERA